MKAQTNNAKSPLKAAASAFDRISTYASAAVGAYMMVIALEKFFPSFWGAIIRALGIR